MSALAVAAPVVEERPAPVAPSPREVLARSRQVCENAARALDEDTLRMERDRMARATVHSVRTDGAYQRKFADASEYAEQLLLAVVAQKAAARTNLFTRKLEP